ncbi:fasciclin domain-containing protein [Ideonella sp. 4Y11]|uniref:Fasciclin domain-containing protein n=1 Tax=Ideonella aquatica TaxID=2824119 RepID=A0A940YJG5_9BURK|nr:fasciclin domain-containing protein [Ideonella aquatica]MBQ0961383.1 fasciclin domain-containing protein [Ideonella aquatica]
MNRLTRRAALASSVALLAGLTACGGSDSDPTLLSLTQIDPQLSILAEAIEAAGLQSALTAAGPSTLLAPTNTAFASLLAELGVDKATLLSNKALLNAVLTYHVIGGRVTAADVPLGSPIEPVGGGFFKAEASGSTLVFTDGRNRRSTVLQADLHASNGVVHVVDKVLLPANQDIVATAVAAGAGSPPEFTILVEAVQAAGLVSALQADGPFTVFAPTDAAFAALLTELGISKAALLADTALLTQVLTYHVVPSLVLKAQVPVGSAITTLQGGSFTVDSSLKITDARGRQAGIVATDVLTSNGVIHVIDRVILP